MIDIEAGQGQNRRIAKPIQISLPTPFIDSKMIVFKRVMENDGKLNWTNLMPLAANTQISDLNVGELLFKQHYTTCNRAVK